ncbi:MAG TPA: phosphotransferase family protein [Solirubrobacteraceae bacterium]|jgi:aminoglycoside phosphotransferase (APT) family kinase protein|nr:phosphotransferase family protein [Solirubrobacteraceae bacterium]
MTEAAPDDVVATHAAAVGNAREPLLVVEPLRAFLDEHGLGAGELRLAPIGEGHSNVTYLVQRDDGCELVLRRPPRGPLAPSTHEVLREARLLRGLAGTAARVPRVLAVCADDAVVGAPFYVMERVAGEVVTAALPPGLDTPALRRRCAEELVDALAEVHAVDWRACGLDGFSRDPDGYLERQLRRFGGLWEHHRTRAIPVIEQVGAWLCERLPRPSPATIVHGDYRLGNAIFSAAAPARLVAILDWEMATLGDPLADVGYLCALWVQHDDPPLGMFALSDVTRAEGFPTREQLVVRYEASSGRSVTDIRWYRTLALWKAAIFMEGNLRRALAGSTDDPWVRGFGAGVVELAERARELTLAGEPD